MEITSHPGGAAALLKAELPAKAVGVAWLGQAGFALCAGGCRLLIDPYLSDVLAAKYRGTARPHDRMIPAPIAAEDVQGLDWVLCSHRHTDHMDVGSLPVLAANNPHCHFLVPRAEQQAARKAGIPENRTAAVNAGETLRLAPDLQVSVLASAHETLETNECGEHRYLGFVLKTPRLTLYHSGDTVLYAGLEELVAAQGVDVALLPVNGRGHGVAGNLDFVEAHALCRAAKIPVLVPHHFGMFAFNTVDLLELQREIAVAAGAEVKGLLQRLDTYWLWQRGQRS